MEVFYGKFPEIGGRGYTIKPREDRIVVIIVLRRVIKMKKLSKVLGAFVLMSVVVMFMATSVYATAEPLSEVVEEEAVIYVDVWVAYNPDYFVDIADARVYLYDKDGNLIQVKYSQENGEVWFDPIPGYTDVIPEFVITVVADGFETVTFAPNFTLTSRADGSFLWHAGGPVWVTPEILEYESMPEPTPITEVVETPEPIPVAEVVDAPEPTPIVEVVETLEPIPVVEVVEAPTPVAPVIQPANTATVANAHFLNLRRGAGVSYHAFAVLARGDQVTVLGHRGGWVNVETARGTGWVFGRYLDI